MASRQPPHFLCFAKESKQRKGDPDAAPLGYKGSLPVLTSWGAFTQTRPRVQGLKQRVKVAGIPLRPQLAPLLSAAYGQHAPARLRHRARSTRYGQARPDPFKCRWSCRTIVPGDVRTVPECLPITYCADSTSKLTGPEQRDGICASVFAGTNAGTLCRVRLSALLGHDAMPRQ